MILKSTLLAVAASAALGLAMLAPTAASAHGGHGGGHGGGGMHGGHGGGMHGGHHGGGGRIGHIGHRHHHHPHWHVRYHRPIWYGVRTVGYTYGATRVAGPCTCLSKEYTQDGRVLFKDLCTNEAAINPPVVAPQQSSAIDVPVQQASNTTYQTAPANAMPQVDPLTGLPK
jgi:hypothetical protein